MSDTSLPDQWRHAEGLLARPRAAARVVERFPRRLGLLHRALAALDDGRVELVQEVLVAAREQGDEDIAQLLALLLTPPARVDPTAVRQAAKLAGAPHSARMPFLDLLRALAVARTGDQAPPSPALRKARQQRPALTCAVRVFTSRADQVYFDKKLRRWSPRAEQVQVAAHFERLGSRDVRNLLKHNFSHVFVDLAPARWPDLESDTRAGSLRRRLDGDEPWENGHDAPSEWLYRQPPERQRPWLASILARLARDVPAGRLHGLAGMAHAGAHLAERQKGMADLARQLTALDKRLRWLTGGKELGMDLVEALWTEHAADLGPGEKLRLAHRFGELDGEPHDPRIGAEVLFHLLAQAPDEAEVLALLEGAPGFVPSALMTEALARKGASPARMALVQGALAIERRRPADVLAALEALAARPEDAGTLALLGEQLGIRVDGEPGPWRRAHGPLRRALELLATRPLPLRRLCGIAFLARRVDPVPPAFVDAVLAAARGAGPDAAATGQAVAALAELGKTAEASELVRALGRSLRRLPPEPAEDRALRVLTAALGLLLPAPDHPVHAVLAPLTRFLLRTGPAPALAAVARVPEGGPDEAGVLAWLLAHHPDLGPPTAWIDRVVHFLMPGPPPPPPVVSAFRRQVLDSLTPRVRTLLALTERLEEAAGDEGRTFDILMDELYDQLGHDIPF